MPTVVVWRGIAASTNGARHWCVMMLWGRGRGYDGTTSPAHTPHQKPTLECSTQNRRLRLLLMMLLLPIHIFGEKLLGLFV